MTSMTVKDLFYLLNGGASKTKIEISGVAKYKLDQALDCCIKQNTISSFDKVSIVYSKILSMADSLVSDSEVIKEIENFITQNIK